MCFVKILGLQVLYVQTGLILLGQDMPARAWGCENVGELDHVITILDAGYHQFGGGSPPEMVVQAVQGGSVTEDRIDESIRRMLEEKFALGLFEHKGFVDLDRAATLSAICASCKYVRIPSAALLPV
jgi:beta-glucosidase-like glycosyl hydrolase